jgi:uncharacterized membrane protein YjfL (UPF0719 family)
VVAYQAISTTRRRRILAQKTLSPHLYDEDKKVGIAVGAIGIAVALFMAACVAGLTMYWSTAYPLLAR